MKTLLRLLFGKDSRASAHGTLFRFYLHEFNAPSRPRYPDDVHI